MGGGVTSDVALFDDERVILKAVALGASLPQIASVVGRSTMTVRRRLMLLRDFDLAVSDGTGWRLTERGREVIGDGVCV